MKIISKQRDFYDSVLAHGQDEKLVFKRASEKIEKPKGFDTLFPQLADSTKYGRRNVYINYESGGRSAIPMKDNLKVKSYILAFCGKLYPVLKASFLKESCDPLTGDRAWITVTKHCYNTEQFLAFLTAHPEQKKNLDSLVNPKVRRSRFKQMPYFFGLCTWSQSKIDEFFDHYSSDCNVQAFVELGVPYFMFRVDASVTRSEGVKVTTLPLLQNIDFHTVSDPYTTFQDISMFLSGVLGLTEVDTVTISDKDMRDAKGFHDMSFKKRAKG